MRVLVYEKENRREIYWMGRGDSVSHRTVGRWCGGGSGMLGASTRALVLVLLILSLYLVRVDWSCLMFGAASLPNPLMHSCALEIGGSSSKVGPRWDSILLKLSNPLSCVPLFCHGNSTTSDDLAVCSGRCTQPTVAPGGNARPFALNFHPSASIHHLYILPVAYPRAIRG